jgi:nickel-dependent lactate racemase
MIHLVPLEIQAGWRILSHDCDDQANLVYLGKTSRGTPVWINRIFMEADIRIVVGDIEPHHFMGFSGGAKGAGIGLAGRETINANHAMLIDPCADIGIYLENPMRMDLEEIGDLIDIHLVVNAVLNHKKEIVEVFAGRPREVMLAGIPVSLQVCATRISEPYEIVVASAGGYPKDINLYQSQKAISHAALFARKGGTIIVAAECREGSGSEGFEAFMRGMRSFTEVEEKFKAMGFQIGPHKAYQLARQAAHYSIYLYSSIPPKKVRAYLLNPVTDISETVSQCLKDAPENPRIAILPYATTTLPRLA